MTDAITFCIHYEDHLVIRLRYFKAACAVNLVDMSFWMKVSA